MLLFVKPGVLGYNHEPLGLITRSGPAGESSQMFLGRTSVRTQYVAE